MIDCLIVVFWNPVNGLNMSNKPIQEFNYPIFEEPSNIVFKNKYYLIMKKILINNWDHRFCLNA